ncbi:copper resistance protein CopC [Oryzobacter telluris]|uniref:copper resistance CopC family protein n=1 Tax=Oryzobacter telluris TaxID=3149179 RepID=UPI00370DC3CA
MLSRRASAIVIVLLVTVALLAGALPVFAAPSSALPMHARLLSSSPVDGSRVDTASEVVLAFNEDVDPTFVKVTVKGPGGSETQGEPTVDGRQVSQVLAEDLPAGEHLVTYRVVSADGHPISGTVTFTSTVAPTSTASATPTPSATPSATPATTPTAETTPTSSEGGTGAWVWVLLGVVVLVGLLALSTQWRLLGGPRTDEEANTAADAEEDDRTVDARTTGRDDPFA